jgi:hypothetical protein
MSFAVTSNPSNEELAEAVNYLLSNFSQTMAINPNTGNITTANYGIVSYLYKFLQVRYADSFDGSVNFSNVPTNRLYYGIRNNDSPTESTTPSDYLWLPVTGGFGTTKFFWYNTTGGRQIETFIGPVRPSPSFVKDTGNAIDLDLITAAAEDKTDPVAFDHSAQIQALEQAIGSIPQPQLGTMAPQNAENVAITGGAINGTPIGATTASTGSFSSLILGTPLAVNYGGTGVSTATANYVFAGPTSGGAAAPTFRALVVADIPALPYGTGDVVGPASATDNAIARFDGTTGKLIQNSVTTIDDTGNASGILSQQFSNGSAVTLAAGKMWYDGSTGSWNMGMGGGNITQQVGEEQFIYGKASAAITDSPLRIVYHTGTVGASGVIQFAPTIAGITDVNAIIGVATENIANNAFGRITTFGVVRGITTNGTAYGETWADDDVIWYNPVTGNPTKVEPVAPNIKIQVGLVINAGSGGSGSFQVLLRPGSILGGTDSNVQFSALANNNLIQYDSTLQYWKNVTPASVTGIGSVANAVTFNNGGAGAASGTTFNGSVARTISYNTIGAQVAGTYVTSVTGTAPVVSSGGTTPAISMAAASASVNGYLTSTDWTTFNNKGSGTVTSVSVVSANGLAGTVATSTTTPAITLSTTITGLLKGNGTAISAATANTDYMGVAAPVTKTTDFTVANGDIWYINNKSGSTCTVTLPAASSWTGRSLTFKNMQAQTLVSASSNVVPIDSTTAGTAILLGVIGNWATMVSDGTNWVIMQAASNNNLLLE